MIDTVILDTGVLGLLTHPNANKENLECYTWFETLWASGVRFVIAEIADYELRRQLLLKGFEKSLRKLDELEAVLDFLPIDTRAMRGAAQNWAHARKIHRKTAADDALDGDAILAAQAEQLREGGAEPVVATTNVGHLSLFVSAEIWQSIRIA